MNEDKSGKKTTPLPHVIMQFYMKNPVITDRKKIIVFIPIVDLHY